MSQPLDVIKSLQASKISQEIFRKKSFSDRAQLLKKISQFVSLNQDLIALDIAVEQKLPLNFVKTELVQASLVYFETIAQQLEEWQNPKTLLPTGVIAASFQHQLFFCRLIQTLALSLAAGNSLIVSTPDSTRVSCQWIQKLAEAAEIPDGLLALHNGNTSAVSELLASHPGIAAFIYYGSSVPAVGLMTKAMQKNKKVQFFLGAKNSCLIHPDFDFEANITKILDPFLIGQGQLDFNCHRLFISQSHEKKFYEVLKSEMDRQQILQSPEDPSSWTELVEDRSLEGWKNSVQQVPADSGKILWGGQFIGPRFVQPTWTQDLSNCSEMQQHPLASPLFIITAVKYTHEMVKWSNTGYLGHSAVIWGPQEKAHQLASQLQVGHVHINKWSDFYNMGLPSKQSFWGNPDVDWSGSFYSDVKKIQG